MTPFTLDLVSNSYTILLYPEPSLFLIPYTNSLVCAINGASVVIVSLGCELLITGVPKNRQVIPTLPVLTFQNGHQRFPTMEKNPAKRL